MWSMVWNCSLVLRMCVRMSVSMSCGYDVYFQTGTDEHGQKIEEKALAEGMTPQEFVDAKTKDIKYIWDTMNTSYDNFVRTTDKDHERIVQDIFKRYYDQGDVYLGEYTGLYCTPCESFWTESQLVYGRSSVGLSISVIAQSLSVAPA